MADEGTRGAELLEALAAAVMDAEPDVGPLNGVADALEAARGAGVLPAVLAAEGPALAAELRSQHPGDALARVSKALSEGQAAPVRTPTGAENANRDAETIELVGDFLGESNDALARADEILLAVEQGGTPGADGTNALFRVFHTIKGVAGFLELRDIVKLAHTAENLLNAVREGRIALAGEVFDVVFEATALLRAMLERLKKAVDARATLEPDRDVPPLVLRLERAIAQAGQEEEAEAPAAAAAPTPTPIAAPPPAPTATPTATAAAAEGAVPGATPQFVVRKVTPSGERKDVVGRAPAPVPQPAEPDPEAAKEGFTRGAAGPLRETVKVDLERVDTMVEMIGELIIVESMVIHAPEVARMASRRLRNDLNQLAKISRDLQNLAMRMRMVPVRGAFGKMARLVRDLAKRTGKDVVLETSGEDTEMDRSMVERIEDPLVHLIRNSLDHGVETAADRRAAGKPERSTLKLSAFHEGGSIVVELQDDGRGLQREKILAKARERGLVDANRELSDAEVNDLIFLPGFSTAAKVTEISGRGVGMDVVKRNVEGMRGRVAVLSQVGRGTTFRMVLPLTLAIIDGMLITCGGERYIVPSLAILESLRPVPGMVSAIPGRGEIVNVRGEILPLLRLRRLLEVSGAEPPLEEGRVVVIEGLGRKVGLVVDDVLTQQQVVIKPLGAGVGDADFLSGAAILSDGRVGLILNVDRLAQLAVRTGRGRSSAQPTAAAG
jgi:two-component system chemotaxis sensor kinase CheA